MTDHKVWHLILSCEHGGNRVPTALSAAFNGAQAVLESHRGWDRGALTAARVLKRELKAPLIENQISRLVVDCNRSFDHPSAFSKWSRAFNRAALLKKYHFPHWRKMRALVKRNKTLHLSVHSFTPFFNGYVRKTDIGILFDACRPLETQFAARFKRELQREFPRLKIHFNRPYRGSGDGLTTSLRGEFAPTKYLGIEIELNQRLWRRFDARALAAKVARALVNSGWI